MVEPTVPRSTVILIPWDPDSPDHVDRMVEQRKQCGWHTQQVPTEWKDAHLTGKKCVYWLTFPHDEAQHKKYIKMHIEQYPKETDELFDTSKTLLGKPLSPTNDKFLPIGHIALDTHGPSYAKKLGLSIPEFGSYWIKSLYGSYVLQGLGIGGAAMAIAERMATEEPLNAKHLLLDTVRHGDQQNKEFAMAFYGQRFKVSTQAWYEKQGYRLIATVKGLYNDPDPTGKVWSVRTVFLQKEICSLEE